MPTKKELQEQNEALQAKLAELEEAVEAGAVPDDSGAERKLAELEDKLARLEAANARSGMPFTTQKVKQTPIPEDLDEGPELGENGEYLPAKYVTRRGNIREDK